MKARALLLSLLLLLLTGCQSLRLEGGFGLGFGVEVSLPALVHAGFGIGSFKYAGHHYDQGWRGGRPDERWDQSLSAGLLHSLHTADSAVPFEDGGFFEDDEHACGGLMPLAWDVIRDVDERHSFAAELGVHLFLVGFRIGFNPWYLWND